MANAFEVALVDSSFKFNNFKDKDLMIKLNAADELCDYINKFLPFQITRLNDIDTEDEDAEENEEESPEKEQSLKTFGKTSRAKTIEELHSRIEKLRGKKINYKEKLLKKGLKNRIRKKQKLEERKQLKNATRKQKENEKGEQKEIKDTLVTENKEVVLKPNLQFNKFVIGNSDNEKKQHNTDPKRLLQQIEKKNEKLKKLEIKGKKDKLLEIKNKDSWNVAIQKAEGVKVKDNVELLKKSISKIKQRKQKSKKKWEEREKQLQSKKEDAQKKRQENIMKKKKERSKKRTKVLIKKGRILPR